MPHLFILTIVYPHDGYLRQFQEHRRPSRRMKMRNKKVWKEAKE